MGTGTLAAAVAAALHCRSARADDALVVPTPAQLAWHNMELGMFFHFDIPVYKPGWDFRSFRGFPDPDLYQPTALDTDQWMEAAKALGAKYAVFVAKHCSGFLQWQSDLYPYGVKQSSWRGGKGDVVASFVDSARKHGIRPGLYASVTANGYLRVDNPGLVNEGRGGDRDAQARYNAICEGMATELWSRYGELFEIWFDGGAIPASEGGPDLIPILEKHQPNAIVFQGPPGTRNLIRWVGNESGVAPYPCWSTFRGGTGDGGDASSYAGDPAGRVWVPGECDVPVRNHDWFWEAGHEDRLYSLESLMEMYVCSVGRNCNLLLNATPDPTGLVPEADMKRYAEFGSEIRRQFGTPIASTSGEGDLVELVLPAPTKLRHVVTGEEIARGERILEYAVDGQVGGGDWQVLCSGQSVGHKRIDAVPAVEVSRIRLRVTKRKATPHVRELAAFGV
jgi:alpha-L-fucosidase